MEVLEEELKKLGINIISSRQDTIISIRIKGLAGKALIQGLKLCDQVLHEKVKRILKTHVDSSTKRFIDPTFGPTSQDALGVNAMCKNGSTIPSKGGSPHQMKVLGLLKNEKIRWERPEYADEETDNQVEEDEEDEEDTNHCTSDKVFAQEAQLFSNGVSSGDVIQGNLGDCWFLSALSVVATRSDLLEQIFWRGDKNKSHGLYVCRFMKNFVWNYVIIDDQVPVFGYSKTRQGKPYFARCRDPNELWVSLVEKAYAKLHGSYEALIGGFIDVALNDLTGMCSEQVILKAGFPGFGEDPFVPTKKTQQRGDPFWEKILKYKESGTLMGCSIQPVPVSNGDTTCPAESSAGNGLYYKHAYALVDAGEITTESGQMVRLVKLRNPWGMGEWNGPWSDTSEERQQHEHVIEQYFQLLKRHVGGNASKRVYLSLNENGHVHMEEITQEITEINANDGTFFMSYEAWMTYFTHFFAGIDFPDVWHGRRVEGYWNETTCGGNITKSTWINNPHFELVLEEQSHVFISLSQEDPRGLEQIKIVPIGLHICSLVPSGDKYEVREPSGKSDPYYRLYKNEKERQAYKTGVTSEPLPPLIIPGTYIPGIDEDGVPQASYTFKQAVSIDVMMKAGRYCIIPSMYMRTNKETNDVNVGKFWISVYSDRSTFHLQGGEKIAEEEEGEEGGEEENVTSPSKKSEIMSFESVNQRRRFEDVKDEFLAYAKSLGIGVREFKMEMNRMMKKLEFRRKLWSLGFKSEEWNEEKIHLLFQGLEQQGQIDSHQLVELFETEIQQDQMVYQVPEIEQEDGITSIHQAGKLMIQVHGAKDLKLETPIKTIKRTISFPLVEYTSNEKRLRQQLVKTICQQHPSLTAAIQPFLIRKGWISKQPNKVISISDIKAPIAMFYNLLDQAYTKAQFSSVEDKEQTTSLMIEPIKISLPSRVQETRVSSLHTSERMRKLEQKRTQKLVELQKRKHAALGDQQKMASLPRLVGGRKSGSCMIPCIECTTRISVSGRDLSSLPTICQGSNCLHLFCSICYQSFQLCEQCYQHEIVPTQVFGTHLRALLIEKIGSMSHLETIFKSFDTDQSCSLNLQEFLQALDQVGLQPRLTKAQATSLMSQFDTNRDGEISFQEFQAWIVQDHVWQPTFSLSNPIIDYKSTVIPFVLETLLDTVWNAIMVSRSTTRWITSENGIQFQTCIVSQCEQPKTLNTTILLEQVLPISSKVQGETKEHVVDQLFQQFDKDHSGQIDIKEFTQLLTAFGMHLTSQEVVLLMHRLERTGQHNQRIELDELRTYVQTITTRSMNLSSPLLDHFMTLEACYSKADPITRDKILNLLHQLHWNARQMELEMIQRGFYQTIGLAMTVNELQRLAQLCHFHHEEPINSGDVLVHLLSSPELVAQLKTFDLSTFSTHLRLHTERFTKSTSMEGIWTSLFGISTQKTLNQRIFLDLLMDSGLCDTTSRVLTMFQLALCLDTLRYQCQGVITEDISYSYFIMLLQYDQMNGIEQRFVQVLNRFLTFYQGQQYYLVRILIDCHENLIIQAVEPIFKYEMKYILSRQDYTYASLQQLYRQAMGGVVTATCDPVLYTAFRTLINRLCVSSLDQMTSQQGITPYLVLVEDDMFIKTLQDLFSRARVPFFWSVTSTTIEFTIHQEVLTQVNRSMSFPQLIAMSLQHERGLLSLIKTTASTLEIVYEVIGTMRMRSSWKEFQSLLSGHQDTYAVIEVYPQGDILTTRIDHQGQNGTPVWDFHQIIPFKEPEKEQDRIDRPIVYTDTVKVSSIPDRSVTKKIQFSVLSTKEVKTSSTTYFMVLHVRKALEQDHTSSRLYCTAYDPFTSCDYTVEGYPLDWNVDYFNTTLYPDHERTWQQEIIPRLTLGKTLTPQLLIKVYNKQVKVERLIGECEISIASAITQEGYLFEDWFSLHDPILSKSCGLVNLSFQFHAEQLKEEKNPKIENVETLVASKERTKPKETIKSNVTMNETISSDSRILELEKRLKEAEIAKREALEQVKQWKTDKEQTTINSNQENLEVSKWKKKMEQVRREQEAQQQEHDTKLAALQAELKRVEREKQEITTPPRAPPPQPIMNLKQAALGDQASAHDLLSTMKEILLVRSPDRPYNGLKKALATVADVPGKVASSAFEDVLSDFGLMLSPSHRSTLFAILDPTNKGRINIEDFFIKLCGDADMYASVATIQRSTRTLDKQLTPRETKSVPITSVPDSPQSISAPSSPVRTAPPSTSRPMNWKEMKQLLILNLPDGWDVRFTDKGRPYFCNHESRSTQWKHPNPDVDVKYSEWFKEHGSTFQRGATSTTARR